MVDELLDATRPRLGTLGVVDPEEDRVAVRAVKLLERAAGLGVPAQRTREVVGDLDGRGSRRRRRPTDRRPWPRRPRASPAGCMRPAAMSASTLSRLICDHLLRGLPRRHALPEVHVVVLVAQAVDPALAQRDVDHLGHGDGDDAGALLRDLQPHAIRRVVVLAQPRLPRLRRRELLHREIGDLVPSGTCTRTARWTGPICRVLPTAQARRRAPLPLPRPPADLAAHVRGGRRELRRRAPRRLPPRARRAPSSVPATTCGNGACAASASWAAHRGAGITVAPADAPIEEGTTVAVITSVGSAPRPRVMPHRARGRRTRPVRLRLRHAARTPRGG